MAQILVMDELGRRTRRTESFRTRSGAEAWLDERRREIQLGDPHHAPLSLTVKEFGNVWVGTILKNQIATGKIRPSTYDAYVWGWDHIEADLGHLRLSALTAHRIEGWEAEKLRSQSKIKKPYSLASVRNLHRTLRRALNDAKRERLIETNPMDGLELPVPWICR